MKLPFTLQVWGITNEERDQVWFLGIVAFAACGLRFLSWVYLREEKVLEETFWSMLYWKHEMFCVAHFINFNNISLGILILFVRLLQEMDILKC